MLNKSKVEGVAPGSPKGARKAVDTGRLGRLNRVLGEVGSPWGGLYLVKISLFCAVRRRR